MSPEDGLAIWEAQARAAHYRAGELAKTFGVAEVTLRRRFRARFGQDLRMWLRELRLQRFKTLVVERRSLKEIATILGLKHESYVSWLFLRAVGVSMREYRRTQGANMFPAASCWSPVDPSSRTAKNRVMTSTAQLRQLLAPRSESARKVTSSTHAKLRP